MSNIHLESEVGDLEAGKVDPEAAVREGVLRRELRAAHEANRARPAEETNQQAADGEASKAELLEALKSAQRDQDERHRVEPPEEEGDGGGARLDADVGLGDVEGRVCVLRRRCGVRPRQRATWRREVHEHPELGVLR